MLQGTKRKGPNLNSLVVSAIAFLLPPGVHSVHFPQGPPSGSQGPPERGPDGGHWGGQQRGGKPPASHHRQREPGRGHRHPPAVLPPPHPGGATRPSSSCALHACASGCSCCDFFSLLQCQLLTSGVSVWQRRSLLFKLSGQTQLLEELAEISVDRLGAITSAADGGSQSEPGRVLCSSSSTLQ